MAAASKHGLWVPSHTNIGGHPKTRKLARRLKISIPEAVGHLHLLWHWALVYAADGDLSKHDAEDIAVGAHFDGEPDDFLGALIRAGFVDQTEAGKMLHDWPDFAGRYLRGQEQRRQAALARWHGAGRMRPHSDRNAETDASDATAMQSREEKTREDKSKPRARAKDLETGHDPETVAAKLLDEGIPAERVAVALSRIETQRQNGSKPKTTILRWARGIATQLTDDEVAEGVAEVERLDAAKIKRERVAGCSRCNENGHVEIEHDNGSLELAVCDHTQGDPMAEADPMADRPCEGCGASLAGKRRQARFCSERCRKRVNRGATGRR